MKKPVIKALNEPIIIPLEPKIKSLKPSKFKQIGRQIATTALAPVETRLAMVAMPAQFAGSGLSQLAGLIAGIPSGKPLETAERYGERFGEAMRFLPPYTEAGKKVTEMVTTPFAMLEKGAEKVGKGVDEWLRTPPHSVLDEEGRIRGPGQAAEARAEARRERPEEAAPISRMAPSIQAILPTIAHTAVGAGLFVAPMAKGYSRARAYQKIAPKRGWPYGRDLGELDLTTRTNAIKAEKYYERADRELGELKATSPLSNLSQKYYAFKQRFVDVSANLKRELRRLGPAGKKVQMYQELVAGGSVAAHNKLKDIEPTIYKGLSKQEQTLLDEVIANRRIVEIELYKPETKRPILATEAQAHIDALPQAIKDKYVPLSDRYFQIMKENTIDRLYAEGLLTKESYKGLAAHIYEPSKFIDYIDPNTGMSIMEGGRRISVPDSGIQKLGKGSEAVLEKDSRLLLGEAVTRTETRIAKNKANQAMYELALANPDVQHIVMPIKGIGVNKFESPPKGWDSISVMVDGVQQRFAMPQKYAEEWVMREPVIDSTFAKFLNYASMSFILKPMATGYNPEFALTNFPRDIMHSWIAAEKGTFSPHLPIYLGQMGASLKATAGDAWRKKGTWNDAINEGMGMQFLTHMGGGGRYASGVGKFGEIAGYLGEFSESWVRLAIRDQAIKKGYSPVEATWIARNYLDFYQGGSWAKAMDKGMPYLNASIQGTRGIFRAFAERPWETTYKMAQVGTLSSGLYLANLMVNPKAWRAIPDYQKVNNWNITMPWSIVDAEGNERYQYLSIAKDQGQRLFASIAEASMARVFENKFKAAQVIRAGADALPITFQSTIPPALAAYIALAYNVDTYMGDTIWKGEEIKAKDEFLAKGKRALQKIFTYRNIWTDMAGGGLKMLLGETDEETRRTVGEKLSRLPFGRRALKITPAYPEAERLRTKEVKIEENTRRYLQNKEVDNFYKGIKAKTILPLDFFKYVTSQPEYDTQHLLQRMKKNAKFEGIRNRRMWMGLARLSPEGRAQRVMEVYTQAAPDKKLDIILSAYAIPGFASDRFNNALLSLAPPSKKASEATIIPIK